MRLKPLGDNVIIKPVAKEEMTKTGIVLPDTADKDKPEEGEVIAVGPGKVGDNNQRIPLDLKVGQKVVFRKYSPTEVKMENERYLVLAESDILAVIE